MLSGKGNCPYVWHGGSPSQQHIGSCWCGVDSYCMCTPSLAIDVIIEYQKSDTETFFIFVDRGVPPPGLAIPGGFVNVDETVEEAALRELKEETNLTLTHLEQFRMYSDPARDKRRHTASMVFKCVVTSVEHMHSGDDAKRLRILPLGDVHSTTFAFDHKTIMWDYFRKYHIAHSNFALPASKSI